MRCQWQVNQRTKPRRVLAAAPRSPLAVLKWTSSLFGSSLPTSSHRPFPLEGPAPVDLSSSDSFDALAVLAETTARERRRGRGWRCVGDADRSVRELLSSLPAGLGTPGGRGALAGENDTRGRGLRGDKAKGLPGPSDETSDGVGLSENVRVSQGSGGGSRSRLAASFLGTWLRENAGRSMEEERRAGGGRSIEELRRGGRIG